MTNNSNTPGGSAENIFLKALANLIPREAFDVSKAPPPPNYKDKSCWAAWPGRTNKSDLVPDGIEGVSNQASHKADVFFIYPTTYFGSSNWNAPLDNVHATEFVDGVLASQASAFNACARVYAPYFRQATLFSFFDPGENGHGALELAYGDVVSAFKYYLEYENNGRPFIIASHSQGTCLAIRLLEEMVDKTDLMDRFVAGYLIGYNFPLDKFERSYKNIRPCQSSRDTGCIISWGTFGPNGNPANDLSQAGHWYSTGWEKRQGKKTYCINPLTWTTSEELAPANLHLGAVLVKASLGEIASNAGEVNPLELFISDKPTGLKIYGLEAPIPHHSTAQIRDGFLYVPEPKEEALKAMTMEGNYHNIDYNLFYMNIRQNAQERVETFLNK